MENIANSEQFDLYLDRKDSNAVYKNCKGIKKEEKAKKSCSQNSETNSSKKPIFITQKKVLTIISKKRRKVRKLRRPRSKSQNKKRHIVFRINRFEKNSQTKKAFPILNSAKKNNLFKIKKIEHRKEKKFKSKAKKKIKNSTINDSAGTEENHENFQNENLLYENNNNCSDLFEVDRIGKETSDFLQEMSFNRDNYERPVRIGPNILGNPGDIHPYSNTKAFTILLRK